MSFSIRGLGTSVPPTVVNQEESIQIARGMGGEAIATAKWLPAIYSRSGVDFRYQVLGRGLVDDLINDSQLSQSEFLPVKPGGPTTEERMRRYAIEAPPLALQAAQSAIDDATIDPASITHLIMVSCTGFVAPGIDIHLIRNLALRRDIQRIQVGFMGCHGAINGMRVTEAIVQSNPKAVVLMVAVELCSLHYYYGMELDKVIANALFADGAAALIATSEPSYWRLIATGSFLIPDSEQEMTWMIGDNGFRMTLTKQIPVLIHQHLRQWLSGWLQEFGLTIESVGGWAVHPGGPKILASVQESLNLPDLALHDSRTILANYGNMSSPTILFILDLLRQKQSATPIVVLGFGPGMIVEAAVIR